MLTRIFLICVGMLIAAQTAVYAYTDPGSGTLIWQVLFAASFGVMFYLPRMLSNLSHNTRIINENNAGT
jgi:hypothetical protein